MISTPRLDLVPATLALVQAELASYAELGSMLGAQVPEGWPPGEYDRGAMEYFNVRLSEHPEHAGWYGWYALLRSSGSEPRRLIGAAGFFGPPTEGHQVEIGYSIVPSFEGQGYATEIVRALMDYAFATGQVKRIIAHTTKANIGSIRVLEKAGFRLVEEEKEGGGVEYACENPAGWTVGL